MEQSLSIIIAAHNAQNTIVRQVTDLLEVAIELANDIEVLIVDDGSIDLTEEVAYDLTRQYPQVRMVRHETRLGIPAAIRTGMECTTGDVVIVQEETTPVRASEVQRLWSMRSDEGVILARAVPTNGPKPLDPNLIRRLMAWGAKVTQTVHERQRTGLQMIRRQAAIEAQEQLEYELERIEQPEDSSVRVRTPNYIRRSKQPSA